MKVTRTQRDHLAANAAVMTWGQQQDIVSHLAAESVIKRRRNSEQLSWLSSQKQ